MRKEEFFWELNQHLLEDPIPSESIDKMILIPIAKKEPFILLYRMKQTKQSPIYHAEGNVWKHTMMVIDEAAKRREESHNPKAFMWAAFLHDIGKPNTTRIRNGKITAYNHDVEGEKLAREFLTYFVDENEWIEEVCAFIRYHMQKLYQTKGYSRINHKQLKNMVDQKDMELLWESDRSGRIVKI